MSKMITVSSAIRRISAIKGELSLWQNRWRESNVTDSRQQRLSYTLEECEEELKKLTKELLYLKSNVSNANSMRIASSDDARDTLASFGEDSDITASYAILLLSEIKSKIALLGTLLCYTDKTTELHETKYNLQGAAFDSPYTVTCSLTTRERDEQIQLLKSKFEAINSLVEGLNHTSKFLAHVP